MHILFLVNNFPPGGPIGGIVTYTEIMAYAWLSAGHQVSIICKSESGKRQEEQQNGVNVIRVVPKVYPNALTDKLQIKFLRDNSARIIFHKEFSWAAFKEMESWGEQPEVIESPEVFGWAWAFIKFGTIPVSIRVHGPNILASQSDPENGQLRAALLNRLEAWCMRRARRTIPVTQKIKEAIDLHEIKTDYPVCLPFVPPELFNVPKKPKQIVCVGRLIPGKGIVTAIRVIKDLGPGWTLVVVGPDDKYGPNRESYRQSLEQLCSNLGIDRQVAFTGALPRNDTLKVIEESSVMIHDSKNDNMPFVLLEALSLGTHVVASKVGGIPETIGTYGTLVDLGDTKSYVNAIRALEDTAPNPNTRDWLRTRHDPGAIQKLLEAEYRELLS